MKDFKYKDKMPNDCPPLTAKSEPSTEGVRLFMTNPPKEDDFLPYLILRPKRRYRNLCLALGLSFFDKKENLIRKINSIPLPLRKNFKKYNFVAIVKIKENLGVYTEPNSEGHFTFWAYKDTNYKDFEIKKIEKFGNGN